jgi:hypothetical protein
MTIQPAFLETSQHSAKDNELLKADITAAKSRIFELLSKDKLTPDEEEMLDGGIYAFHNKGFLQHCAKLGINGFDEEGFSFVTRAVKSNNQFGLWTLRESGADFTKPDAKGRTAESLIRETRNKGIIIMLPVQARSDIAALLMPKAEVA